MLRVRDSLRSMKDSGSRPCESWSPRSETRLASHEIGIVDETEMWCEIFSVQGDGTVVLVTRT